MWYNSKNELHINDAQDIIKSINDLIIQKYELTSTLQGIIDGLINKGFKVLKSSKGLFEINVN